MGSLVGGPRLDSLGETLVTGPAGCQITGLFIPRHFGRPELSVPEHTPVPDWFIESLTQYSETRMAAGSRAPGPTLDLRTISGVRSKQKIDLKR